MVGEDPKYFTNFLPPPPQNYPRAAAPVMHYSNFSDLYDVLFQTFGGRGDLFPYCFVSLSLTLILFGKGFFISPRIKKEIIITRSQGEYFLKKSGNPDSTP